MKERLQKIISEYGIASRRAAECMIADGKVTVNGLVASLGMSADTEADKITVDGKLLTERFQPVYIMLNKPRGYITTASDDRGRKTVMELVSDVGTRVFPIGRLDMDTEGLLLFTNDGEFANIISHPSYEKNKTYIAHVEGSIEEAFPKLSSPMDIDGHRISPATVRLLSTSDNGGVLSLAIHEGRNRQIRKMCSQAGLTVLKLRRISIGGLTLGDLKPGNWRRLTEVEKESLLQK